MTISEKMASRRNPPALRGPRLLRRRRATMQILALTCCGSIFYPQVQQAQYFARTFAFRPLCFQYFTGGGGGGGGRAPCEPPTRLFPRRNRGLGTRMS